MRSIVRSHGAGPCSPPGRSSSASTSSAWCVPSGAGAGWCHGGLSSELASTHSSAIASQHALACTGITRAGGLSGVIRKKLGFSTLHVAVAAIGKVWVLEQLVSQLGGDQTRPLASLLVSRGNMDIYNLHICCCSFLSAGPSELGGFFVGTGGHLGCPLD